MTPAAALLALTLLAAPPHPPLPEESPCAAARAATGLNLNSWPQCIDVTFTGNDVTGLPPLTFTWEVSSGLQFSHTNPGTLDTALLDPGAYSATLTVSNTHGSATSLPVFFVIETLRSLTPPSYQNLGAGEVQLEANTEGAVEYRWHWGDGSVSPWLTGCDGYRPTHTYPAPGTYAVRLSARNCKDPTLEIGPFTITVTSTPQLEILDFAADCPFSFCIFDTGEAIAFRHDILGDPTTYAYDWNGDGLTDQLTATPALTHAYPLPGTYVPRLTVSRGTQVDTFLHVLPIVILDAPPPGLIFEDGFESGDLSAWSGAVGAAPTSAPAGKERP